MRRSVRRSDLSVGKKVGELKDFEVHGDDSTKTNNGFAVA
jgi:hypothetical protein